MQHRCERLQPHKAKKKGLSEIEAAQKPHSGALMNVSGLERGGFIFNPSAYPAHVHVVHHIHQRGALVWVHTLPHQCVSQGTTDKHSTLTFNPGSCDSYSHWFNLNMDFRNYWTPSEKAANFLYILHFPLFISLVYWVEVLVLKNKMCKCKFILMILQCVEQNAVNRAPFVFPQEFWFHHQNLQNQVHTGSCSSDKTVKVFLPSPRCASLPVKENAKMMKDNPLFLYVAALAALYLSDRGWNHRAGQQPKRELFFWGEWFMASRLSNSWVNNVPPAS